MKYLLSLLAVLNFLKSDAQITYPDSCLSIEFYFNVDSKPDTIRKIKIDDSQIISFFYSNDSLLNLGVLFKNNCNQNIATPSEIRIDMPGQDYFSIEGFRISDKNLDTLSFAIEYDYREPVAADYTLPPREKKLINYSFPLGFEVSEKGNFKFRLRFLNPCNYIPVAEWKYYYTNWIYLTIE